MNDSLARVHDLTAKLLDDELTASEAEELQDLLRGDQDAQIALLNDLHVHANLHRIVGPSSVAAVEDAPALHRTDVQPPIPHRGSAVLRSHYLHYLAGAACLVLLIAAASWLIGLKEGPPADSQPTQFAGVRIEGVVGDVGIVRGDAVLRSKPGTELQYGDRLESGDSSTARLVLHDGSVLALSEQCTLSLLPEQSDIRFHLHTGSFWAQMVKQHQTVRFTTSHASTSVLGTVLQVSATAKQTRVDVCEGEVLVAAIGNPRQNLAVRAGQYVEATDVLPDEPSQIPLAPAEYHIELSEDKPVGWLGRWTATGGLRAVPRHRQHPRLGETTLFEIMSPFRTGGFFTLHQDSVLEYTARFQKHGFMHAFFGTYDPLEPSAYSNVEIQHKTMRPEPGGWRTYRVPLNGSLRIGQQLRTGAEFPDGRIVVFVLFSMPHGDLGMELGRVRIYRESERDRRQSAASVIDGPVPDKGSE